MGVPHSPEPKALHKIATIQIVPAINRPVTADVLALDLSGDLAPAVAACLDGAANFRAMELGRKLIDARRSFAPAAIYIIGAKDIPIVKVGHATHPALRLCNLQIGNWHELRVHGLVWVDTKQEQVERFAHKAASEMEIGVRGEWIEATPEEACELVLKAARYAKVHAYDSGQWIKNWSLRMDAMAKHKGISGRIAA